MEKHEFRRSPHPEYKYCLRCGEFEGTPCHVAPAASEGLREQYDRQLEPFIEKMNQQIEDSRESERLTADDYNIVINARAEDVLPAAPSEGLLSTAIHAAVDECNEATDAPLDAIVKALHQLDVRDSDGAIKTLLAVITRPAASLSPTGEDTDAYRRGMLRAAEIAAQDEMIDYPTGYPTRLAVERTQRNIVDGIISSAGLEAAQSEGEAQ